MDEAYTFDDDRRAIVIHRYDLPSPWINYLSNGRMHAFISQAGGGFAWWKSAVTYRLTRYRTYNLPIDSPGFYIYLRQPDGQVWSPTFRPCLTRLDQWSAAHQPGQTTFEAQKGTLKARVSFFVAPDFDALIWDLDLCNDSPDPQTLDVFAYVELSQFLWKEEINFDYYWRHTLKTWHDVENDAQLYLYHAHFQPWLEDVPLVYLASSQPSFSYSGDRDSFIGNYRDEQHPLGVEKNHCGNASLSTGEPCAALQNPLSLTAEGKSRITFFLGVVPGALMKYGQALENLSQTLSQLRTPGVIDQQHAGVEAWWADHLDAFHCSIPDPAAQRQINTWSPVNSVQAGRYSRAVNAQATGVRGIGFRDTCQDMLAIAYRKPDWAEATFRQLLAHQYEDGHAVTTFHPDEKKPHDTSLRCDTHLWLPFLAYALMAETGDLSLFDKRVPFLAADDLSATEPLSVWDHLTACIRFTEAHLGSHGIPLTLGGDWNDIINKFSQQGRGESVFAAQQYVTALRTLIAIAGACGRSEEGAWLRACLEKQERAILACAWDGEWWLRAFDDDANPVGSKRSEYGKLFINSQSWAVLSQVGSASQLRAAMQSVKDQLDTGVGLKKLTPGFPTWPQVSDPFTGYGPGCGENGAIFCQANTWAIIAEALLGNGSRAWKYFLQIVPHNALKRIGLETYQGEAYAWASNIVGPENPRFGWANVTHITGTAAWMDIAATQYLLGIRPELNGLRIDPCVPEDWRDLSIKRTYRGCQVQIAIQNPAGVEKGVRSIVVDGKTVPQETLPVIPPGMLQGKKTAGVQVILG
jgi:cellobiose phosphorylase